MDRYISLDPEDDAFIDGAISTGRYGTADDVVRESIRLLREKEAKLERFRAEIQKGIDAADRGELIDLDEAFDRLNERIRAAAAARAK